MSLVDFLLILALTNIGQLAIIFFIVDVIVFWLLRLENGKPADEDRDDDMTKSDVVGRLYYQNILV